MRGKIQQLSSPPLLVRVEAQVHAESCPVVAVAEHRGDTTTQIRRRSVPPAGTRVHSQSLFHIPPQSNHPRTPHGTHWICLFLNLIYMESQAWPLVPDLAVYDMNPRRTEL